MMPKRWTIWSADWAGLAGAEGWGMRPHKGGYWEIETICEDRFQHDFEAVAHVCRLADAGSRLHSHARELHNVWLSKAEPKPQPKTVKRVVVAILTAPESERELDRAVREAVAQYLDERAPGFLEDVQIVTTREVQPVGDPLTIAYVAIGAMQAWEEAIDGFGHADGGQLEFINSVIFHAPMLDAMAETRELSGCFAYEVAEPFGKALGEAIIRDETVDPRQLAFNLLDSITVSPHSGRNGNA